MNYSLHDKNNNPLKCESDFKERLKKFKTIYAYEEHEALTESQKNMVELGDFCSTQQVENTKTNGLSSLELRRSDEKIRTF